MLILTVSKIRQNTAKSYSISVVRHQVSFIYVYIHLYLLWGFIPSVSITSWSHPGMQSFITACPLSFLLYQSISRDIFTLFVTCMSCTIHSFLQQINTCALEQHLKFTHLCPYRLHQWHHSQLQSSWSLRIWEYISYIFDGQHCWRNDLHRQFFSKAAAWQNSYTCWYYHQSFISQVNKWCVLNWIYVFIILLVAW